MVEQLIIAYFLIACVVFVVVYGIQNSKEKKWSMGYDEYSLRYDPKPFQTAIVCSLLWFLVLIVLFLMGIRKSLIFIGDTVERLFLK